MKKIKKIIVNQCFIQNNITILVTLDCALNTVRKEIKEMKTMNC